MNYFGGILHKSLSSKKQKNIFLGCVEGLKTVSTSPDDKETGLDLYCRCSYSTEYIL